MSLLSRVSNALRTERLDRELDDEVRFHMEALVDDLVRGGMSRERAVREANRLFGSQLRTRESSREAKLTPWLESVVEDARLGVRSLRKSSLIAGAAIVSLALAIGACTATFSVLDPLVLRPLPVPEPDRLIHLSSTGPGDGFSFSYPALAQFRAAAGDQAGLFGVAFGGPQQTISFGGVEEPVRPQWISGNGLAILGVEPAAGRLLNASETSPLWTASRC